MASKLVDAAVLTNISQALLRSVGSSAPEAAVVAENLVLANLKGHDSHGVGMLPNYLQSARDKRLKLNAQVETVLDFGLGMVVLDGARSFGQIAGAQAMDVGIERASVLGVSVVALRNAHHLGRIGHWAEMCTRAGMASIHLTNVSGHHGLVAPYAGYDARLGTNPVTIGYPGTPNDFILDFATSKVALGKVREALARGDPAPVGGVMDAHGIQTDDPAAMFKEPRGALLPFAEFKGSGLAVACELFNAAMFGGYSMASQAGSSSNPNDGTILNSMVTIVMNPKHLVGLGHEPEQVFNAIASHLRESPKSGDGANGSGDILLAGEIERRTEEERLLHGIPLASGVIQELGNAAQELGVDFPEGWPQV